MDAPACAVGRLEAGGPWVGFAPSLDDGYLLVIGGDATRRASADAADLVSLAIAYFEDALDAPPEELAATHGDIGSVVRHAAETIEDPVRRRAFDEAVDAIDDGLAADVVIERLSRALGDEDALDRLRRRASEMLAAR
jgi:hypothetical protein